MTTVGDVVVAERHFVGRLKLTAWAVVAFAVLSACSPTDESELKRLALPIAASDRSQAMWNLWLGAWIAILVVFVLVFALILYAPFRYRRKASETAAPPQVRYNLPIEALYTVAPVIVVAAFFFHTVDAQNTMLETVDNPDHTVEVVASKWQWTFNHLDGNAAGEVVHAKGDTENLPELVLPKGESVRFQLISPDVIHSFWIPEFYFKMDVVPGKIPGKEGPNTFDMTPVREGEFMGRCAELCGTYHGRMIFKVRIVSPAEYREYLETLPEGRPVGSDVANQVAGLKSQGEEN